MDNNNEIRKANRKAMPKFILSVVIGTIVGGGIGFFSAKYGLNALSDNIKAAGEIFGLHIAPWLMLTIAIIVPLISIPLYNKAKKLIVAWNGDDEEVPDAIEKNLSITIWISGAAIIISYFLIAASYSDGLKSLNNDENILQFIISIVAFLSILFETVIIQQKCVDLVKRINPEKKASVYDMKFQKKWLDSCDEAEKLLIGKCAFKAYSATNTVCSILAIVLAVCALVFEIGFLPSLVVCLIWIVNMSVYCKEAMKYS